MSDPLLPAIVTTPGGYLLVLATMLPLAGMMLAFALGGRQAERIALVTLPVGLAVAVAAALRVVESGGILAYDLGNWAPPLGVGLRADGFSVAMMVAAALVLCVVALYARKDFAIARGKTEERAPFAFWTLLMALLSAVNLVFLSNDLFTLYVALELLTFAGVPLVCLDGRAETLQAALRYLLFALLGAVLYLLGVALLYGSYGTMDITLLAAQVRPDAPTWIAAALMTAGLMAKTALFPLYLWLPPAHAGAPAAGSAVLSALVVKGSFFLIVRLWFSVLPSLPHGLADQLIAACGAGAIVFGSVMALRQARLKLLIAYSTVAQIGYLFLMFPLASLGTPWAADAWAGGILQAVSHAFAKGAMFMAAGLIAKELGHDRIAGLGGIGRTLPITVFALGLGGLSLMGLPPSGGFTAKWLLLTASIAAGQWWWALVMLAGGLFAGGYVFRILTPALTGMSQSPAVRGKVTRGRELLVLGLALCSIALGLVPMDDFAFLQIGRVAGGTP